MKSKYRSSICDEILEAKLRCAIGVQYTPELENVI